MEVTRKQKLLELKQEFAALHEDAEGKLVGGFATIYSNMMSRSGTNDHCNNYHCNNDHCDNTDCTNDSCKNSECVVSTPTEKPVPSPSPTQAKPTFTPPEINFWCQ